ncbi:MAG: hypothetical protein C0462_14780 [Alcanivorax sp.]|nr:hypothetical protein [Alcanivorax sp.]PPD31129.1 MAG: hypothetical protein CTY21_12210 [Methylomonas sp.]
MKQHVEEVDNNDFAPCAVYAHHLFFNEALHDKSWQVHNATDLLRRYREYNYTDQSESAQALRKAANRLSEDAIKEALRTQQRQQLRDRIRAHQQILANWMRGRDSNGRDASKHFSQFVSLHQALLDYAWLPVPRQKDLLEQAEYDYSDYSALWVRLSDILDGADNDPALYDTGFSIQDNGAPRPGADPMDAAITALLADAEQPLFKALFPSAEQVADNEPYEPDAEAAHRPPESSEFRPSAFAAMAGGLAGLEYLRKSQALTENIIASLLFRFQKQWMNADALRQEQQLTLFARWGKSTGHSQMADLKVAASQSIPEGYEVVHVETEQRQLTLEEEQRLRSAGAEDGDARRPVRVLKPGGDEVIASSRIQDVTHKRGVLIGTLAGAASSAREVGFMNLWSREAMQYVMEQARLSGTHEVNVKQVIRPQVSDLAHELNDSPSGHRSSALQARAINTANRALPPSMAVLEVFNIVGVIQGINKHGMTKTDASRAFISGFALLYALLDTSVRLAGAERTVRGLNALFQYKANVRTLIQGNTQIAGITFSNFRLAGAGLALAGGILAFAEGHRQAAAGNRESAIAHWVEAGALTGLSLSVTAQAAVKKAAQRTALTRVLAIAGPWGWAFMAIAFTAAVIAERRKLSELERWAAFGPFGNNPSDRLTHEYADLDGHAVHQDLLSQLFTPQTGIHAENNRGAPLVEVEILAPGVGADDTIEHHFYQLHSRAAQIQGKPRRELLQPVMSQDILADNDDPRSRIGLRVWYPRDDINTAVTLELHTRLHSATINDWLPELARGESDIVKQGQDFYTSRYIKDGWHYTECRLAGKFDKMISRSTLSAL